MPADQQLDLVMMRMVTAMKSSVKIMMTVMTMIAEAFHLLVQHVDRVEGLDDRHEGGVIAVGVAEVDEDVQAPLPLKSLCHQHLVEGIPLEL